LCNQVFAICAACVTSIVCQLGGDCSCNFRRITNDTNSYLLRKTNAVWVQVNLNDLCATKKKTFYKNFT
jgi:hypothetical protein